MPKDQANRWNTKMCVPDPEGGFKLRIWHSAATKRKSPRYRVKCGCCAEHVDISYGDDTIEIGGVIATKTEWARVLSPLICD